MSKYTIPIAAFLIVCLSLATLYSDIYPRNVFGESSVFLRQLIWIVMGGAAFFAFSRIYYRRLLNFIYPFYSLAVFLLAWVLAFGGARLGAQRWIKVWWFNLQPSEFVKLAIILVLSHYFSRKGLGEIRLDIRRLSFFRGMLLPFLIIALPFGLILKQPDLGTGLLLMLIFLSMVYFSGVKPRYIISILALGAIISPAFWHFLKDYQRDRLLVFLNPDFDPLGAGYTIIQSRIAVGSGRLFGKGWLSGTQGQLNFLPESHTDFIFGIFSEETGFLGFLFLLGLYLSIIYSCFKISEKSDDNFGKMFSLGVGTMLAFQMYINISMAIGLSPVVGLPLPLMSYGGSSLLVTFISLGIVQNINRRG